MNADLEPTYNKLLFWQRFIWLIFIVSIIISLADLVRYYGNFASNNSSFYIGYVIFLALDLLTWIGLLFVAKKLKESINVGTEYQEKRSAQEFGKWIKKMGTTWTYLTLLFVLMLIKNLYNQVL